MSQVLPFLLASPGLVAIPAIAYAQQAPSAAEAQAALNTPPAQSYTRAQLDQMLAPVALYPDQVLMQVLMAATFPQQVIDAGQWLQAPNNAQLHGDALVAALQPLPWDPSVKSLVAFPQIIVMMDDHMDWTQSLGVAFASQQVAAMAEVQTLRNRAAAAGQFHSNSQIRYVHSGGAWTIEPVSQSEIYIPVYNPAVVYGHWEYPDYPPIYVPPPPGFVSAGFNLGPGIAFSVGFGVVAPLWGWGHPDWHRHEFVVNQARYSRITATNHFEANHVAVQGGAWHRTAPVVTVVAAPHRAAPENGPRPEGTARPASIHAPPPRPGARGAEHPAQAPGEARPGEAHPAPGQPPHPEEAHPTPGQPPHPGATAHPGPEGAHPGQPPHPEEHAAPPHPGEPPHPGSERARPGEPPHPGPEGAHPGQPPHPEEHAAPPAEHAAPAPHPAEHAAPAPHPAEHAAPAPHPAEHAAPAPRPEERAAPPHPAEAPHPAAPPHPAEAPHPAAPPHPAEAPHPAAPPPAAHPAPPHPAPAPAKPEEEKK